MEELILMIQQGHNELYTELWLRVYGLIAMWANEYYRSFLKGRKIPGGISNEDLIQSGFFALVDAVEGYDPSKGAFNTYLCFHVRKEFRKTIGRTDKQLNDPLNSAFSLDVPKFDSDPEGPSMFDYVPDTRDRISETDEQVYQEQLHDALECALNALPEREATAIRSEFWDGCSLKETAERIGCLSIDRARQIRNNGLQHIRNSSMGKKLEQFLDEETSFYNGMGLATFKRTKMSGVERVVFIRDRKRKSLQKKLEILNKMIAPD